MSTAQGSRRSRRWLRPYVIARPSEPAYLWRLNLAYFRAFSLKLHRFLSSDPDPCLHDHPWPFVSVILSGGYFEVTSSAAAGEVTTWYGPGSVLSRPAIHAHRVRLGELACGACAWCQWKKVPEGTLGPQGDQWCDDPRLIRPWTLFLTGRVCRSWGFWTRNGWVGHRELESC